MSSKVILVQGSSLQISKEEATSTDPQGLTFDSLDCVGRQVQWQGGQATENDVTTMCSTAKEFRLGLPDSGTLTVTGHWVIGDGAQKTIKTADGDKKPRLIVLTFSDGSKFSSLAIVQQRAFEGSVDGVWSGTFNFRLTGATKEEDAPASS